MKRPCRTKAHLTPIYEQLSIFEIFIVCAEALRNDSTLDCKGCQLPFWIRIYLQSGERSARESSVERSLES